MSQDREDLPPQAGEDRPWAGPSRSIQAEEAEQDPTGHPAVDDDTPPGSGRPDEEIGEGYVAGYGTTGTAED